MKDIICRRNKTTIFLITIYIVMLTSCQNKETDRNELQQVKTVAPESNNSIQSNEFAVEPPPFSEGTFPCTDCHANFKPNPVRRKLVDWHTEISDMFNHDSENRWCLDCHDLTRRDSLKLASGKLLSFKESYKLCGQCHGEKLRDWKVGVHGKRTGFWNGKKEYLLCVSCHNPHSPKFKELKPMPPPVRQDSIILNYKRPHIRLDTLK